MGRKLVVIRPMVAGRMKKSFRGQVMAETKFVGTPRKATTHVNQNEDLIFEKSSAGKKAYRMAQLDVPAVDVASLLGDAVRTDDLGAMPD
jgi:glycine dehydrogenase subunit 2